jgi:hypothetical protein
MTLVGDTAPKRFRLAVDALAVVSAVALILSGYLFYTRINESRDAQHNTVQAIRTVLCFAQLQVERDSTVTAAQRARAVHFYTQALERIDALPCHPITTGGSP